MKNIVFQLSMEWRTFIKASCINNIRSREKSFYSYFFWSFESPFFSERVAALLHTLLCMTLFTFLEKRGRTFPFVKIFHFVEYCLWEVKYNYLSRFKYLVWCSKMYIYFEKEQFKMLLTLSLRCKVYMILLSYFKAVVFKFTCNATFTSY